MHCIRRYNLTLHCLNFHVLNLNFPVGSGPPDDGSGPYAAFFPCRWYPPTLRYNWLLQVNYSISVLVLLRLLSFYTHFWIKRFLSIEACVIQSYGKLISNSQFVSSLILTDTRLGWEYAVKLKIIQDKNTDWTWADVRSTVCHLHTLSLLREDIQIRCFICTFLITFDIIFYEFLQK